jgi:hypothetical protein
MSEQNAQPWWGTWGGGGVGGRSRTGLTGEGGGGRDALAAAVRVILGDAAGPGAPPPGPADQPRGRRRAAPAQWVVRSPQPPMRAPGLPRSLPAGSRPQGRLLHPLLLRLPPPHPFHSESLRHNEGVSTPVSRHFLSPPLPLFFPQNMGQTDVRTRTHTQHTYIYIHTRMRCDRMHRRTWAPKWAPSIPFRLPLHHSSFSHFHPFPPFQFFPPSFSPTVPRPPPSFSPTVPLSSPSFSPTIPVSPFPCLAIPLSPCTLPLSLLTFIPTLPKNTITELVVASVHAQD